MCSNTNANISLQHWSLATTSHSDDQHADGRSKFVSHIDFQAVGMPLSEGVEWLQTS
jgi:hypothetical protein